jgi:pullulanase/glycogen debranching enzyme
LKIAEPFADKILDPEDPGIPAATYPNLKTYPAKAYNPGNQNWYLNRVSVFQTNQTPYAWQVANFTKPKKESLVIYEVLIRDIFESGNRNYQTLIDTIPYFKKLGINAIELMPAFEYPSGSGRGV